MKMNNDKQKLQYGSSSIEVFRTNVGTVQQWQSRERERSQKAIRISDVVSAVCVLSCTVVTIVDLQLPYQYRIWLPSHISLNRSTRILYACFGGQLLKKSILKNSSKNCLTYYLFYHILLSFLNQAQQSVSQSVSMNEYRIIKSINQKSKRYINQQDVFMLKVRQATKEP